MAQASKAKQPTVRRIGLLQLGAAPASTPSQLERLLRGLAPAGAPALELESRYGWGVDLELQAHRLLASGVDIVVANGTPAALAAQRATRSVPIVFAIAGDPIDLRLVSALANPGGNATGIYTLTSETSGKRVAMLHDAAPRARSIGLLWTPNPRNEPELAGARAAADVLKLKVAAWPATTLADVERRFGEMRNTRVDALSVLTAPLFFGHLRQVAAMALQYRLPSVAAYPGFADAGGLMSYAADEAEVMRGLVAQVDKILQGAKPMDIPVQRAQSFVLTLNLKSASVLRISMPPALTALAQRVIR